MEEKNVTIDEYSSYSTMRTFAQCHRQVFYHRNKKDFPPYRRAASMCKGAALHRAIGELHRHPDYNLENIFRQELDLVEAESPVPIDWGEWGFDKHVKDGIEILDSYWRFNAGIPILSSENWFYFSLKIDKDMVQFRGRFDQLIDSGDSFIVRELKTGMLPDENTLRRDLQLVIQAHGILFGYMSIDEEPYIGPDDEKYHIHHFEKSGEIFKCTVCDLQAIRLGIKPSELIYYHVPSCRPYKQKSKGSPDEPRREPALPINLQSINFERFYYRIGNFVRDYKRCVDTGIWEETANMGGFSSPCKICDYSVHCDNYLVEVKNDRTRKSPGAEEANG